MWTAIITYFTSDVTHYLALWIGVGIITFIITFSAGGYGGIDRDKF
jgi:hypothetical protein